MKQFVHPNQISVKGEFKISTQNLHNDSLLGIMTQSSGSFIVRIYFNGLKESGDSGSSDRI